MDTTGGNVDTSCRDRRQCGHDRRQCEHDRRQCGRDRRQCGHVMQRQEAMWTCHAETGGNVDMSCRDRRQCGHVMQRQEAMWTCHAERATNSRSRNGGESSVIPVVVKAEFKMTMIALKISDKKIQKNVGTCVQLELDGLSQYYVYGLQHSTTVESLFSKF